MPYFTPAKPSMKRIRTLQNEVKNLRCQVAKNHFYSWGNRLHFLGLVIAILFALASPIVLLYKPDSGPLLGAIAGAWIFLARLVFEPVRQKLQTRGAIAQEAFDCNVLGLPWNDTLAKPLSEEEIRGASKSFRKAKVERRHRDWYPASVEMRWPRSVITCQRSNAVWGRRQHNAYAIFLVSLAAVWSVFGIILAVTHHTSLADYLTTIALPSLPALLDATELAKGHFRAARRRQLVEDQSDLLFHEINVTHSELREIQDRIFDLRRSAPPVADWFYKLLAKGYEEDMVFAAAERAKAK
jgi:hypothetical protein